MKWPESWSDAERDPEFDAAWERELQAELGAGHPLFGVPVAAIGNDRASDDVLFRLLDGSGRVAVVHLTYAQHPEPPPWPMTVFFEDFEAFVEQCSRSAEE